MKAITSAQMRELDKIASAEFDIPGVELMRRAGRGVASIVAYIAEHGRMGDPLIQLIAGRGNNGGDAFAAACFLHEEEFEVEVLIAGSAAEVKGDALRHLGKMRAAGIPLTELATKEAWEDALHDAESGGIIVDGVLGIGVNGPPRGPIGGAIHYINKVSEDNIVIAIDVPSGLDADTGASPGETVMADITATIGLPKTGLLTPQAVPYVGSLDVISIGIPADLADQYACQRELITGWDARRYLPRRPRTAHKGQYGHVLIIGGATGYAGAAALAARAAMRSGVGLVTVLTPRSVCPIVAGGCLEAMTQPGAETESGSLSIANWEVWKSKLTGFDAVVVGPGMTRHPDTAMWVRHLLKECRCPLLLDADALNVLEGAAELIAHAQCPIVITPHPGELGRLMGCSAEEVQSDREGAAGRIAKLTRAIVVLKGAGTIVTQTGKAIHVNMTGNPGMATGGMGDVLSGITGALLAQGLPPFEAACAGTFLHGRAGDNAMWRQSQAGMTAGLVIDELPGVFREVVAR